MTVDRSLISRWTVIILREGNRELKSCSYLEIRCKKVQIEVFLKYELNTYVEIKLKLYRRILINIEGITNIVEWILKTN